MNLHRLHRLHRFFPATSRKSFCLLRGLQGHTRPGPAGKKGGKRGKGCNGQWQSYTNARNAAHGCAALVEDLNEEP